MSEKMIVACPECETRFVAPLEKFLPNGRKVRCAKCGHSWFHHIEGHADLKETAVDTPPSPPAEAIKKTPDAARTDSIIDRAARAKENQQASQPTAESSPLHSKHTETAPNAASITSATTEMSAAEFAGEDNSSVYADELQPIPTGERSRKRSFWPRTIFYTMAAALIAGALGYFFKDGISSAVPALDPPLTSWKQTVDGVVSTAVPSTRALKIDNVRYDLSNEDNQSLMLLTAEVTNESGSTQKAPALIATIYDENNAVLRSVPVSPAEAVTEIAAQTRLDYFLRLPSPPEKLERVELDFVK